MAKTRQDNDMTDYISLVYTKTKNKMSGPIWPSAVCDETRWDYDMTNHMGAIYIENDNELS